MKLTVSFDQSAYIRAAISSLLHEALWGSGLAILVILIFLASWSATGIIAVAIPLSIVATFVLLYFSGQTLNVFTLGGLALGVGRLVDDSIVELENIHRHLAMGGDREGAVLAAAQEVAMPIFVSTITTIVVFFPVVFLTGVARNLFIPLALTIAFALMMSFFVSRTVTPILCLKYLDRRGHRMGEEGFARRITRRLDRMDEAYARSLRWVLGNRWKVIVSILVFFVASMGLVGRVGTEFFPPTDESQFQDQLQGAGGHAGRAHRGRDEAHRAGHPGLARSEVKAADGSPVTRTDHLHRGTAAAGAPRSSAATPAPTPGQVQAYLVPRTQRSVTDEEAADKVRSALRRGHPRRPVLLLRGRHREADPQLRRRRAHRRRDRGVRPRGRVAPTPSGSCRACAP